jgi:nitric oxide reductase NorE protein
MSARGQPQAAGLRLPGEPGVWIFVLADMSFFGLLFASYVYEQSRQPALFYKTQGALDARLGLANTVILLTSSWLVALAIDSARRGGVKVPVRLLRLAAACGAAFIVVKGLEYHARLAAGASILDNDFYMFYFVITAIHLLHVVAGLILLSLMPGVLRGADPSRRLRLLESAATYWHMVDLLWVLILALLYQVGWGQVGWRWS